MRPWRGDRLGDRLAAVHMAAEEAAAKTPAKKAKGSRKPVPPKPLSFLDKLIEYYRNDRSRIAGPRNAETVMLDEAYGMFVDNSPGSGKWLAEALLMGGMPFRETDDILGIPPGTSQAYAKAYFDLSGGNNRAALLAKVAANAGCITPATLPKWGYKVEVMTTGLDCFVRARIMLKPSAEDKRARKELVADRIEAARLDGTFLAGNINNYGDPSFIDMSAKVGATYSAVLSDKDEDRKKGARGGLSEEILGKSASEANDVISAVGSLMQGVSDPEKPKEEIFFKTKEEEE